MKSRLITTVLFLALTLGLFAQDIPDPMYPYRLVNDFSNIFTPAERQGLENRLLAYNDSTSTQTTIVTVNDLGGYDISDYAIKLGEKWGVGQADKRNGIVILVKPKVGNSRGQVFISTGYGVEAKVTYAFTGRVIREKMIPYFQSDDYFGGVNAAVDAIIDRLSGEFDNDSDESDGFPAGLIFGMVLFFFILLILLSKKGDQHIDRDGHNRGGGGGPVFFPPTSRGGGRSSGGWGGGGGGFGGFGGGSFGGGGAGGSW